MKRFPHLTLFASALAILTGCMHAQTVTNGVPADRSPVSVITTGNNPPPVVGTACNTYSNIYYNWKTGVQTSCVNGLYQNAQGGGGMIYPGIGIPVSVGSAWSGSIAAPNGAIVGTTDTQTLTNKTVDGVAPITFTYLDATSSIQAQINARLTGIGIQQSGTAVGTAQILNFSTNLTATVSSGVATITATGGGGVSGGTFATAASSSSVLTVGTDCNSGTPCMARVGSLTLAKITASMTATATTGSGTNDTAYIYFDPANGNALTIGDGGTVTLTTPGSGAGSGMVVAGSAITGFPAGSLPLFMATIQSDNFTAVSDQRAQYSVAPPIAAGSCAVITRTVTLTTVAFDNTCSSGGSFNGGTITAPLTISTDGLSTNTPLLKLLTSNSSGYNTVEFKNDTAHGWQISEGGSATSAPYTNALYFYDETNSNAPLYFDSTYDTANFVSTSATSRVANFSNSAGTTAIAIANAASGGHQWLIGTDSGTGGTPGALYLFDGTAGTTEMRAKAASHTIALGNLQIGASDSYTVPTCDSTTVGTFAWDATTTPKKPEVCDGSAWHHLTYAD